MKINNNKTKMLCISAARGYTPASYIITDNNDRIESSDCMKVLGFHFDMAPNVKHHMKLLHRRFKCRMWSLRHVKRNVFKQSELLHVYKAMIRPVAEYCSVIFHTMATQADSLELERIQMQALKGIYGWRHSYSSLLEKSGIERLDVRRERRFVELAKKMHLTNRFSSWFPLRATRRTGLREAGEKFKVYTAHCSRYFNSPLNQMRRRLNEFYAS